MGARKKAYPEFKREVVELVKCQGLLAAEGVRRLDAHANLLRKWQSQAAGQGPQAFPGKGHQTAVEKENRRLGMEREILKKATAFFAKESK
ncbi:transposase [Planctellipticum variicoloris]|nr:transposase [Planctomycetaceae bacterium SH412]